MSSPKFSKSLHFVWVKHFSLPGCPMDTDHLVIPANRTTCMNLVEFLANFSREKALRAKEQISIRLNGRGDFEIPLDRFQQFLCVTF